MKGTNYSLHVFIKGQTYLDALIKPTYFFLFVLSHFKEKRAPTFIFRICNLKISTYTLQIDECTSMPKLWGLVLQSHACPVQPHIYMEDIE